MARRPDRGHGPCDSECHQGRDLRGKSRHAADAKAGRPMPSHIATQPARLAAVASRMDSFLIIHFSGGSGTPRCRPQVPAMAPAHCRPLQSVRAVKLVIRWGRPPKNSNQKAQDFHGRFQNNSNMRPSRKACRLQCPIATAGRSITRARYPLRQGSSMEPASRPIHL